MEKNNFLWGNSVSSMQTEGAWDTDGKGLSVYDIKPASKDTSDWKVAIDEYHRYDEDFDLMKNAGMNCYRFQLSWSRIIPDGDGQVNELGMQYYENFIDSLLKKGITPVACLYHFDMPLTLAKKYNGLLHSHVRDAFVRFAQIVIKRFAPKVKYWIPFNEQNCMTFEEGFKNSGYLTGNKTVSELYKIAVNSLIAYTQIADYVHNFLDLKVGGMVAYQEMYPASSNPKDVMYTRKAMEFVNEDFLQFFATGRRSPEVVGYMKTHNMAELIDVLDKEVKKHPKLKSDFLAFSYYYSLVIDSTRISEKAVPNYFMQQGKVENKHLQTSEFGWQIDPIGFRNTITKMYNRYSLPIFPAENGIGVTEHWNGKDQIQDDYRIEYHKDHIDEMIKSITCDGAKVLGYLGWGLIDIPSSKGNVEKRYGLVYVNRTNHDIKDLKRIPKKSYFWFKNYVLEKTKELNEE
ncbi:glycoside hydrolase family 1 protein [Liquorilactobacillus oeni]|uniref:6-phospho-beta-glucosidase n=1 Tax=Liquorilactobacillus oeni DSM 19972 TaxID=1423777 RepID=A0A0R1M8L7_9LACO|nr:glycoside hydrolase family 1 protein [Liquorilactobacillus oeni]KRL04567.1 6-phospho-beta-glucosidase [Liquorilactobacillus oeni DSM 19972]